MTITFILHDFQEISARSGPATVSAGVHWQQARVEISTDFADFFSPPLLKAACTAVLTSWTRVLAVSSFPIPLAELITKVSY